MTQHDRLLGWALETLEELKIPYMISGSLASSLYGRSRPTNDVDVVIDPAGDQLNQLLNSLPSQFYASKEAAREAYAARGMFNVIDPSTGAKIDFVIRKDRPYSLAELQRRRRLNFLDVDAFFASPEDVILSKLEWAQLGESQRQVEDATYVASAHSNELDLGYLRTWARELGVDDVLNRVLSQIDSND